MKNNIRSIIACLSLVFFVQFSQDSSITGREKPRVNCFGSIKDKNGNQYAAENILISGAYKQIALYIKPSRSDISPKSHEAKIDLPEINQISVVYEGDKPKILSFNKKEYIELEVVSNDKNKTKNSYIIERNRKVFFDEPNQAGPIEHTIALEVLDTITIDGYKERDEQKKAKKITKNYSIKLHKNEPNVALTKSKTAIALCKS